MNRIHPYEVAAYYFPQYHADPRNDAWHGKGWTEWELVKAARPRFPGHRQPIVPAWGYFDESKPEWTTREIDLAADHGITSFLYDWYWYGEQPFLQGALEQGFLQATNTKRLKFALMWANHDWLYLFPAPANSQRVLLASGQISLSMFERMTDYIIEHYFLHPSYLLINDEPYFSIYELGTLLAGFGSLRAAQHAFEKFRAKVCAAGFPGVHLNAVVWGFNVLPSEMTLTDPAYVVAQLGFASTTTYAWVHHYDLNNAPFPQGNYVHAAQRTYEAWEEYAHRFAVPYHPNVSMGWDPSPRTLQGEDYQKYGYPWTAVLEGNTPEAFRDALAHAKAFLDHQDITPKMVTLNAWNEWTEGSYLLPDIVHGTAYVEAIRSVFGTRST